MDTEIAVVFIWTFLVTQFGEGNGTPLQYSCLENPTNGGAWWAAVYGVTTEQLHFHFLLSYIGEGNGNPLQCSCLENPRDGGAWWAAVYGVAQSQTGLKRLSSSSSSSDSVGKNICLQSRRCGFSPWVGKISWRRKCQPIPVLLPRESHGQRSLKGNSPWDRKSQAQLSN